ncbi:MAG: DUF1178 family protein [Pseudomonadota bacterium]
MIKYALTCSACEADFEAWFASSSAYDDQKGRGLVTCAICGSPDVSKQIMAPAVAGTKRTVATMPDDMVQKFVAKAKAHVAKNFDYVGDKFADEARAMYYGETDERAIWGATTPDEAKALEDEGVPAAPLPAPLVPEIPPTDDDKIN